MNGILGYMRCENVLILSYSEHNGNDTHSSKSHKRNERIKRRYVVDRKVYHIIHSSDTYKRWYGSLPQLWNNNRINKIHGAVGWNRNPLYFNVGMSLPVVGYFFQQTFHSEACEYETCIQVDSFIQKADKATLCVYNY